MFPWNLTVTIKPSEGSLAAVTELIVIARRSAAVSPGRWTIEDSARVTIPARAGTQITAALIATTARPNAAKLPHPKVNISSLRCTPFPTDQNASATQKFQPRATQTHNPMLLESSKRGRCKFARRGLLVRWPRNLQLEPRRHSHITKYGKSRARDRDARGLRSLGEAWTGTRADISSASPGAALKRAQV